MSQHGPLPNLALLQSMGAEVGAGITFCQDQVAVTAKFLRRLEDMSGTTSSGAEEACYSGRSVGECAASVGLGVVLGRGDGVAEVSPLSLAPRIWGCGDGPPLTRLGLARLGYLGSVGSGAVVSSPPWGSSSLSPSLTLCFTVRGSPHPPRPRPWSTIPAHGLKLGNRAWRGHAPAARFRLVAPLLQPWTDWN